MLLLLFFLKSAFLFIVAILNSTTNIKHTKFLNIRLMYQKTIIKPQLKFSYLVLGPLSCGVKCFNNLKNVLYAV